MFVDLCISDTGLTAWLAAVSGGKHLVEHL